MLCLAISQSGRSPDLLAAARAARDSGAIVVALVNDPDSAAGRDRLDRAAARRRPREERCGDQELHHLAFGDRADGGAVVGR